jgi:peptide deformylase
MNLTSFFTLAFALNLNPVGEDMPKLAFAPVDHPILRRRTEEVPVEQIQSQEIQDLIDEMLAIAKGERADVLQRVMVGLAAPQIGVDKRVILVDIGVGSERNNLGTLHAYINPQIIWRSEETELGREGCYSTDHIHAVVPRASKVRICGYDREGNFVVEEHVGFTARIFQHEVDHLNGIRFPDRMGPDGTLLWVEDADYEEYRKNWDHWEKTFPYSEWLKMRGSE